MEERNIYINYNIKNKISMIFLVLHYHPNKKNMPWKHIPEYVHVEYANYIKESFGLIIAYLKLNTTMNFPVGVKRSKSNIPFIFRLHTHIVALYVELYFFHLVCDIPLNPYAAFYLHIYLLMDLRKTASMKLSV